MSARWITFAIRATICTYIHFMILIQPLTGFPHSALGYNHSIISELSTRRHIVRRPLANHAQDLSLWTFSSESTLHARGHADP